MGFFLVIKAEIVRSMIIMRRYWFRTVTGMVIGYSMLVGLIVGFMNMGPQAEGVASQFATADTATRWALGFIIGMFAFGILGMFTQGLQQMAQSGQLEQLCMSPHGLVTNFLARSVVAAVSSVVTSSILIWLIAATVGGKLHFDPLPTIVLLLLTFANLIGFGFMSGGLVLVFKQTGQVATIVRMGFFALAILASEKISTWPLLARWIAHALPITDASICLKYVLVQGQNTVSTNALGEQITQHASVFLHTSFFFLIVSCVFWTFTGIACFRYMETWSRNKGTLGAY